MMGIGLFPALFTLNFTWDDIFGADPEGRRGGAANDGAADGANTEETREQQLQKLLLVLCFFMLMSFVFFGGDVFLSF